MSLYEEGDWSNSDIEPKLLKPNELLGYVSLPAFAIFADLVEAVKNEDFPKNDPKWGITFRLPKDGEAQGRDGLTYGSILFAVVDIIARKTWKAEADEKLEAIWACIENGLVPEKTDINVQDGNLYKPEHNAGNWLVKATRRLDEGAPDVFDEAGNPIFDEDGDPIGDESKVARPGDFCQILISVWCQRDRGRINFTLEGVRLVKRGAGFKGANKALRKEALQELIAGELPALPDGLGDEGEEEEAPSKPTRKAPKKAAAKRAVPKKAAAKKAAAKKGARKGKVPGEKASVFRKRGK
jgi:hypothetical protein